MKLAHSDIENLIEFTDDSVSTLVIENRTFFREFLNDISAQLSGYEGKTVLSEGIKILDISKNIDLTDSFLSFSVNRKSLLTKIQSRLEKEAVSDDNYLMTLDMVSRLESYIYKLTQNLSCNLMCGKINASSIIKMAGLSIVEDYEDPLEQIIDYMELVREFDKDKLFVFVNMRGYFENDKLELFFKTVIDNEYKVFLVDSFSAPLLKYEKRLTIDEDLCEF